MSSASYPIIGTGGGGGGSGTVTSVALSDGSTTPIYAISGSPVTTSGNLTFTFKNQNANLVLAGPSTGAAAQPSFRSLATADLPFSIGDLTDVGTDGIVVTGGAGSVIGSGTSIAQHVADASHNGYLSSTDWSTFNNKGSGSVTAVSVASANGFAGTSSGGATPALTLSTSITGILQGNGTAISAASTTGSGSVVLATAPTMTNPVVGTQTQGDGSTKAASTSYVDTAVANAVAGLNPAIAVNAATTAAGDTSGLTYNNGASGVGATFTGSNNTALTVDGFTFTAVGQRLLVKNDTQSPSGAFNGIYNVTQIQTSLLPPILTRATDYNTPSDMNNTGAIPVVSGTANGTTTWVQTSLIVTVGTTPLVFAQFSKNPAAYLLVANNLSDVATKATSFNNISPVTTTGDIIYSSSGTTNSRLAIGSSAQILTVSGGLPSWQAVGNVTVVSKTTTYSIASTDGLILCSGSAFTATLPTAASVAGETHRIVKTDSSLTNIITVGTTSSQTIGFYGTSFTLNTQGEALTVVSDGSNWQVVSHDIPSIWTAVTPTGTLTTNCTYSGHWKRIGDSIMYQFKILIAGAPGATNPINVNIPSNMTIDTAKLDTSATFYVLNGFGDYFGSANSLRYILAATYVSTSAITLKTSGSSIGGFTDQAPSIMANTDFIYFTVTLPISGWEG